MPGPPALPDVVLTQELADAELRAGLRDGVLHRVRRGAFLVGDLPHGTWERRRMLELARCVAVVRQSGGAAVLSHRSAALVHGTWVWGTGESVHTCVRYKPPAREDSDVRRHHLRDLTDEDITTVNGLRVTSLERTAVDCARSLPPREGLAAIDGIVRMLARPDRFHRDDAERAVTAVRTALQDRLGRLGSGRGLVRARAVVDHCDGLAESAPEADLRWIAVAHGLPRPVVQMPIVTAHGTYFGDLGWPLGPDAAVRAVVAEYDGEAKYADRRDLYDEKLREDSVRESGVLVRRFTKQDRRDVGRTFQRLCEPMPASVVRAIRPVPELLTLGDIVRRAAVA